MAKKKEKQPVEYRLFPDNPRFIREEEFLRLNESLGEFGSLDGIVVNTSPGKYENAVISGNQKVKIIGLNNLKPELLERFETPTVSGTVGYGFIDYKGEKFPYREVYWSSEKCEIGNIRANNYGGHNDPEMLALFSDEVPHAAGIDIEFENKVFELLTQGGFDEGGGDGGDSEEQAKVALSERFIAPPFSVLDTRQGYWNERKKHWRTLIGDAGESREFALSKGANNEKINSINNGVSVLDPVLAELMLHWFGIPGGRAFDPFAGDTVFGYVSATIGIEFTGIELREEQVKLNMERVEGMAAVYVCDDGQNVAEHIEKESMDFMFSCPPYFDLEVYSNNPRDASNQKEYADFLKILDKAFTDSIGCLKQNRFAVIVVGDIRGGKQGFYRQFPEGVKEIFARNGMLLYNELVLVESLGTLPQRAGRSMVNRKVMKCHQNVLVFYKGDTKQIQKHFQVIEFSEDYEGANMES